MAKPNTEKMVELAISHLNDRHGTSLHKVKKYITENFDVNIDNYKRHITKCVRKLLENGTLLQVSGLGANGKFKFPQNVKNSVKKAMKKGEKLKVKILKKKNNDMKEKAKETKKKPMTLKNNKKMPKTTENNNKDVKKNINKKSTQESTSQTRGKRNVTNKDSTMTMKPMKSKETSKMKKTMRTDDDKNKKVQFKKIVEKSAAGKVKDSKK
ncbi:histone H1.1, embryonic-like [Leptopilina heterotoma]|uniref:histone H1.1, embryonic-like n=1 Tax=Leptopilina heterotoma TaxID=63436 RepID=UPI001CA8B7E2|nr:histone H1.1, embryonic-like [Leptopilina heterotoma]